MNGYTAQESKECYQILTYSVQQVTPTDWNNITDTESDTGTHRRGCERERHEHTELSSGTEVWWGLQVRVGVGPRW